MMRQASEFYDKPIAAVDGGFGTLSEIYFDERAWRIRYLVIEFVNGNKSKEVLISPLAFTLSDGGSLKVQLTADEIKGYPDMSSATPVSMEQKESSELLYTLGSLDQRFETLVSHRHSLIGTPEQGKKEDDRFRSIRVLSKCQSITVDGVSGRVEGVLFDDRLWNIRFILVRMDADPEKGLRPLVVFWVDYIDWKKKAVYLECRNDYVMRCPAFDPTAHLNISYEDFLEHYNPISGRNSGGDE